MKTLIICAITLSLMSCGQSRNDLMTQLMSDRKTSNLKLSNLRFDEKEYQKKALDRNIDSATQKLLIDSSAKCWSEAFNLEKKIKAINFSIDSLEKMN